MLLFFSQCIYHNAPVTPSVTLHLPLCVCHAASFAIPFYSAQTMAGHLSQDLALATCNGLVETIFTTPALAPAHARHFRPAKQPLAAAAL